MNKELEKLIDESLNAIFYIEDSEAKELLKKVQDFVDSQNLSQTDPSLFQKLEKLIIHLKIVAFPHLSDEECEKIMREHYLDSFDIEVPMEQRLVSRLFLTPYSLRDEPREKLKKALRENQQKIGSLTVSQWIDKFEKKYDVKTRSLSAAVDFVNSDLQALELDSRSKYKLKTILHDYDYLLVSSIPALEPDLSEIIKNPPLENEEVVSSSQIQGGYTVSEPAFRQSQSVQDISTDSQSKESLKFSEALKKYPEIGEQLITFNKIKLKSFPDPVRPSINNWLSDYNFNLGYEGHSSMQRGNYLFQNENTRNLSSADKQKLSYILKAYDEGGEIEINKNLKQIIFPISAAKTNIENQEPKRKTSNLSQPPKDIFEKRKEIPSQKTYSINDLKQDEKKQFSFPTSKPNVTNKRVDFQGGRNTIKKAAPSFSQNSNSNRQAVTSAKNISFSSPQRFSFESNKQDNGKKNLEEKTENKLQNNPQPMRISPRSFNRNSVKNNPSKNIVDLKNT